MEINGEPRPLPPIPKLVQPKLYELEDEYEKVHVEHEYADVQDSIGSESNKSFNPERGPMPVPRSVDLYDKICTENSESTENHTQKEPDRPVENKKIKFAMLSKEKRSISNLYEEMDFKMNQKLDKFKLDLEAALAARAKLATKPSRVDQDPILKAPTCILKKQSIQNMQNAQKEIDSDGQNVKNTTTDETNSEISNQSSFCLFYPFRRIFGGLKKVKKPAVSDYKARRKLSAMQRSDLMAKFEDRTGMVEKHNQCVNKFKKSSSESPELSPAENVNEEVPVIPFSKTKFRRSFRKFCRQISKDFKDEETKVGNGDDLLEDEAAIYENLDRAMKSYIGEHFYIIYLF